MIDKEKIEDILKHFEIPCRDSGKNVTKGWINTQCPFCSDESNHCGINPKTERFNCWICGKTGSFVDLLIKLTGLSYRECKDIISTTSIAFQESTSDYIRKVFSEDKPESILTAGGKVKLPERFEPVTYDTKSLLLHSYLKRRNILMETIVDHNCGICRSGPYMNRLIIPVIFQGEVVSFQAADLSGFAELKYVGAPKPHEVNNYLYNYDRIDKRMVVVEGVLDAWRVGDEAAAAFTSSITAEQRKLILAKNLDELYICFDGEVKAYYKSREEIEYFTPFIPVVEAIDLPLGEDPDSLGREKIYELIEAKKV